MVTSDLSPQVIKIARRLQALKPGTYQIIFIKARGEWLLAVSEPRKTERIRRDSDVGCAYEYVKG